MNKEIKMMAEPIEMDVSEKPKTVSLSTRLRNRSMGVMDEDDFCSTTELLYEAANEIDRLRALINSKDPVAILKEIWRHHQPVYLFEAIQEEICCKRSN